MAAVVIAKIGIAAVAAAIASCAPPGRFPADMPHNHEAGGEDENDPGYDARGLGHGGSGVEAVAVAQTRPLYVAASPFDRPRWSLSLGHRIVIA
jgi:hypothetical protein